MPGPLPTGEAARRNKPKIPTTNLPAAGYQGPIPESPIELGPAGSEWWVWAWRTPQAEGWSDGDLYFIAHRAQLEDDLKALDPDDFDRLDELLGGDADAAALLKSLRAQATGKASLVARVNDMDDKLGLSPKGCAQLRWKIVDGPEGQGAGKAMSTTPGRRGLELVETAG